MQQKTSEDILDYETGADITEPVNPFKEGLPGPGRPRGKRDATPRKTAARLHEAHARACLFDAQRAALDVSPSMVARLAAIALHSKDDDAAARAGAAVLAFTTVVPLS